MFFFQQQVSSLATACSFIFRANATRQCVNVGTKVDVESFRSLPADSQKHTHFNSTEFTLGIGIQGKLRWEIGPFDLNTITDCNS